MEILNKTMVQGISLGKVLFYLVYILFLINTHSLDTTTTGNPVVFSNGYFLIASKSAYMPHHKQDLVYFKSEMYC